ncbi:hypothetical protein LWT89_24555 [Enterobacter asburiae]|nr:hypothetical protein [Enterobacter asburiae]
MELHGLPGAPVT